MNETYEQIVDSYNKAVESLALIRYTLSQTSDGFKYLTKVREYGSISWSSHNNELLAKEIDAEYYGDNGIVEIYTNNPDHSFVNYSHGGITIMDEQDMINLSKEDISMSRAMCNWITKSY